MYALIVLHRSHVMHLMAKNLMRYFFSSSFLSSHMVLGFKSTSILIDVMSNGSFLLEAVFEFILFQHLTLVDYSKRK